MKLLGRNKGTDTPSDADDVTDAATADVLTGGEEVRRTTAPKGRPTPKRDASRRRGPVAPAPKTASEARKRRKELRATMSREEKKIDKAARRAAASERRERMMAGEEAYLLPRDRGPVRRYVRDLVDSRRNVLGLFMPSALSLLFIMLAVPQVQVYISPAMLVLIALMIVDGIFLGRRVNRLVDAKFPDREEGRWKLGFYAASRASQLRRMRAPRPQVDRGADVE